jgi:hypothetical protein
MAHSNNSVITGKFKGMLGKELISFFICISPNQFLTFDKMQKLNSQ